jgi:hypothetical protein
MVHRSSTEDQGTTDPTRSHQIPLDPIRPHGTRVESRLRLESHLTHYPTAEVVTVAQ